MFRWSITVQLPLLWAPQENLSWYSVLNIYHKLTIAFMCRLIVDSLYQNRGPVFLRHSVCVSVCVSVCLLTYLCVYVCLCVCVCVCVCWHISVSMSVCVCVCVCLSVDISLCLCLVWRDVGISSVRPSTEHLLNHKLLPLATSPNFPSMILWNYDFIRLHCILFHCFISFCTFFRHDSVFDWQS